MLHRASRFVGVRMKPDAVFVALERVIEDGAQRDPTAQRNNAGAERMVSRPHVREFAAGLGARCVNRAQVPVKEDAAIGPTFEKASRRRIRVGHGAVLNELFVSYV